MTPDQRVIDPKADTRSKPCQSDFYGLHQTRAGARPGKQLNMISSASRSRSEEESNEFHELAQTCTRIVIDIAPSTSEATLDPNSAVRATKPRTIPQEPKARIPLQMILLQCSHSISSGYGQSNLRDHRRSRALLRRDPELRDVWATGKTLESCRDSLMSALEIGLPFIQDRKINPRMNG